MLCGALQRDRATATSAAIMQANELQNGQGPRVDSLSGGSDRQNGRCDRLNWIFHSMKHHLADVSQLPSRGFANYKTRSENVEVGSAISKPL